MLGMKHAEQPPAPSKQHNELAAVECVRSTYKSCSKLLGHLRLEAKPTFDSGGSKGHSFVRTFHFEKPSFRLQGKRICPLLLYSVPVWYFSQTETRLPSDGNWSPFTSTYGISKRLRELRRNLGISQGTQRKV